jgi:mono/diheme cytochrome c family protein
MGCQTRLRPKFRYPSIAVQCCFALASIVAASTPAIAQDGLGDAVAGRRLAEKWCSACHQIEASQSEIFAGPSFLEVAKLPSTTALSLNVFLRTSHDKMPNFQLTRADTENAVAYILSLRKK